ncbi:Nf-x1 finger transcription [Coniochaeta hoffmannii]|uniref:Nf-x1 finger transcription n=1 Tax=Coniochaeta hoffmannii TaxID=91930 RepID=A0AA38VZS1_9PEZI|nr:Nf-x1 finger transcription [Coniochaeta hoffmannii]
MERRKQKRAANANENIEAEHICLSACGRTLKCGKHTCQQLCHRVLQPPQPCGTRPPECRFDCTRPRPCGHPTVSHQCHPDDVACPKCPFLVEKPCICGKKTLKNQPCWFDAATCGLPCGKKLKCGAHECRKLCHRPGDCEDVGVSGTHCNQICGKVRKSCDHTCAETCHAPYPCREDKPCQSKTFITCPCQHRKQEIKCQATWTNPSPSRDTLKCDDECLRLQRNRRLADALNVDPDHTDDFIPYSDTTLKLYRDNTAWAQQQEREFRVFAADPDEKRIRFKPMPANQRAFIHALAEDFGLDSESQDPEPHRHVAVFKTPRFVSAPRKTLSQCVRAVAKPVPTPPTASRSSSPGRDAFNALLLSAPRFGITIDELEHALAADLASARKSAPTVNFTTTFLNEHEVVIQAHTKTTAAAIATASTTPQAVESVLKTLKPAVSKTVSSSGLAGGVTLCRVDPTSHAITKREGGDAAGWNAVASRGPWRRAAVAEKPGREEKKGFGFVALRRLGEKTKKEEKKVEVEAVEDDWLVAAEKMDAGEKTDGKDDDDGSTPKVEGVASAQA